MGNQPPSSPSASARPIYTVRSDPWPNETRTSSDAHRSASTEPADSDECHACAATQDSAAVSPFNPSTAATNLPATTTTTSRPLPAAFATNTTQTASTTQSTTSPCYAYSHSACPLNRAELGRAAWAYLHTLAAYYPTQPSSVQQSDMRDFMLLYMRQYPCLYCRDRTMEEVDRNAPRVGNRQQLSEWVCELHNEVNERLGKPAFDCRRVDERWRTRPSDGSCGPG